MSALPQIAKTEVDVAELFCITGRAKQQHLKLAPSLKEAIGVYSKIQQEGGRPAQILLESTARGITTWPTFKGYVKLVLQMSTVYKSTCWEIVKRAFTFEEIEVKCQVMAKSVFTHPDPKNPKANKHYGKALATPYYNARMVMERLDEAFTPAGWRNSLREVHIGGDVSGITQRLEVKDPNTKEWIVREDCADPTDIEPLKGAVSGALKRCFMALGNRSLQAVELGWYECELRVDSDNKPLMDKGKPLFKCWTQQGLQLMQGDYERQVRIESPKTGKPMAPLCNEVATDFTLKEDAAFLHPEIGDQAPEPRPAPARPNALPPERLP